MSVTRATHRSDINLRVKQQWTLLVFLGVGALAGAGILLEEWCPVLPALRWLTQAMAVALFVLWRLWRQLTFNRPPNRGPIFPGLGWGTTVTVIRGMAIAAVAGFLCWPAGRTTGCSAGLLWVPGLLYLSAVAADFLDGYLARATGHVTRLGTLLDTQVDALGLLMASLLAVQWGQLPLFYLPGAGAYYALVVAVWLRRLRAKPIHRLGPWPQARLLAGLQMALVGLALTPMVPPWAAWVAAAVFLPLFLVGFLRDWGVISGRIRPNVDGETLWEGRILPAFFQWTPVVLRAMVLAAGLLWVTWEGFGTVPAFLADLVPWQRVLFFCFCIGLVFGMIGRSAALGICGLLIAAAPPAGGHPWTPAVFGLAAVVVLTGTGRFSLWQPEERFLYRKVGTCP